MELTFFLKKKRQTDNVADDVMSEKNIFNKLVNDESGLADKLTDDSFTNKNI